MDQKVILRAKLNGMKAKNDLILRERTKMTCEKPKNKSGKLKKTSSKTKGNEFNSKLQDTLRENKILKRILQGKRVDRISSSPWRWNSRVKSSHLSQDTHSCESETPDYDDFTDMFRVPTPVSPLPPTPVASPSHELSQDLIYDSLPPMERSMVLMSPWKDLASMEQSMVPNLKDLLPLDSKPPNVYQSLQVSTLPPV
ncbi:hypothetical protein TNCV_3846381 [Trichonephila clavipes]|nr:hypothetical protein TNCV_3846381 [Trichonephila clavipes]